MRTVTIITFFLFFFCHSAFPQSWVEMMHDSSVNFYEVQKHYSQWEDSVKHHSKKSLLYRIFNREKIQEQEEVMEEAQEHFHHWKLRMVDRIDEQGNRLSAEALWQRYNSYKQYAGGPVFPQSQGTWVSRGPYNPNYYMSGWGTGMMTAIAICPSDSNIIMAGAAAGGLWKSVNEGATWFPLTDSVAELGTSLIEFDPVNGSVVYAGIGGKLYKSLDTGATWMLLNTGVVPQRLYIDPANTQSLLLTGSGLRSSNNGGLTWTLVNTKNYIDLEVKPGSFSELYAVDGLSPNILFHSVDGGYTFDTLFVISGSYTMRQISVSPSDNNFICLTGTSSSSLQAAVSYDGGQTFTVHPVSANISQFLGNALAAVSPNNTQLIMHGYLNMARSTNGGASFAEVTKWRTSITSPLPYIHCDQRALRFHGSSFWTCNDGGIYKTMDGGLTWIDKTSNLAVTEMYSIRTAASDTSVFLGGALHNHTLIHKSTGWYNTFAGDGSNVAVKPNDPNTVYGKNQYYFVRSFDGGATQVTPNCFAGLTESTYGFTAKFPIEWNHQNPNSMFLMVDNVWKSVDNGNTMVKISSFANNTGGEFIYVCRTDSNIIFTMHYHTTDGGLTWTPNGKMVFAVDPDEPNKVWARSAFGPYTVYRSNDMCATWTQIPTHDIPPGYYSFEMQCANNSDNGVYLASEKNLFYIDDRLSNWQPFNNGLPYVGITDMEVLDAAGRIRIATNGRGIWESALFDHSQSPQADFLANKYTACPGDTVTFFDNSLNNGPGYSPVYQWSFPGATPAASGAANPKVVYPAPGQYDVTLIISNANGTDSLSRSIYITVGTPPVAAAPLTEGFEGGFPPAGWNVNNYTSTPAWAGSFVYQNTYGGYGLSARSVKYFTPRTSAPQRDHFTTPQVDLSAVPYPVMVFDYCYPVDTINPDTLQVFYTTDCGLTRQYIWQKGGQDLATALQTNLSFTPNSTTWSTDTVSLYALLSVANAQIGIEAVSRDICNIYIDNINIVQGPAITVGIDEAAAGSVQAWPNPAAGAVQLKWKGDAGTTYRVRLISLTGQEVYSAQASGSSCTVPVQHLAAGVYGVVVENGDAVLRGSVMIAR